MDMTLKLKELREEAGISQEQLAVAMNTTRMTLAGYENGKRIPDVEFLLKLSKYFNCTPNYLLNLTPFKTEKEFENWFSSSETLQKALTVLPDNKRNALITALNFLLADNYNINRINTDKDYLIDKFITLTVSFTNILQSYSEIYNNSGDTSITKDDILNFFQIIEKEKSELFNIINTVAKYLFEFMIKNSKT